MGNYKLIATPNGINGIRTTLKWMSALVNKYKTNEKIRELALHLVENLPEKNWTSEASEILRFCQSEIRYVKDVYGVETLQTPLKTLKLKQGDCDDKSILCASLLSAIGHPTRFVAAGFTNNSLSHVFVETYIGSKWVAMETTMQWVLGRRPKGIKKIMIHHNKRRN